ncbi:MAG: NADH-quinone oxidoreductase subunit NuoG [Pseudomonadota bacterium]
MPIVKIDGKSIEVDAGTMIIEAADRLDIQIPRFCYHEKLTIAANCRMCLVDVEKAPKTLPACATPVADGMVISTNSAKAHQSQRAVMEFLLINHPLDCPICDQGGECELQDVAVGYGKCHSQYAEPKRVVADKDIGPLIETEMTRCIHCTRCVRFGSEIAGLRELGVTGRGEHSEIGTFLDHSLESELSGNVIDLCPVGALTSKPFRYKARAWELLQSKSIAPHDCLGSNVLVHSSQQKVLRVVPRKNEQVNECWLSDRDRFSYQGLNSTDRLLLPEMKKNGLWTPISWSEAFDALVLQLQSITDSVGLQQLGVLASPNLTTEEAYLLQAIMRHQGCHNLDHQLRHTDARLPHHAGLLPQVPGGAAALQASDCLVLIGSNIHKEQPLLGHRIRQAQKRGAAVIVLQEMKHSYRFTVQSEHTLGADLVPELLRWQEGQAHVLNDIIATLKAAKNPYIVLGSALSTHPQYHSLVQTLTKVAALCGAPLGILTEGANAAGLWLSGLVPHRGPFGASVTAGLSAPAMLAKNLPAYWAFHTELEFDSAHGAQAMRALGHAKHVAVFTPYLTEQMRSYADIAIPMAIFAENEGTYINCAGDWQSFKASVTPPGEARPLWKILRVLADRLGVPGLTYDSVAAIRQTLLDGFEAQHSIQPHALTPAPARMVAEGPIRLASVPLYATDSLVRRATALQETPDGQQAAAVHINTAYATALGLTKGRAIRVCQPGANSVTLPVMFDEAVPNGAVYIPFGHHETSGLGQPYDVVEVSII